jgi:NADH-quinone oxidoreductase subunit G
MFAEKAGSTTNLEGRVSRLNPKITPPGTARADWMIAAELAERLGADLGLTSVEQITDEIAAVAPAYAGLTCRALTSTAGFDGILAGEAVETAHHAPPTMGHAEAPEIIAPDNHGEAPSGTNVAAETPDPSQGSAAEQDHGGDGETEPAAPRPALLRHTPVASNRDVPAIDGYSLRLVSAHKLYDGGTLVQHSPSLAPLAVGGVVRVSPYDLDRLGLTSGDAVRVSSSRGAITIAAEVDLAVPKGVAVLAFDQPGAGAADLIDASATVTDIRLETIA